MDLIKHPTESQYLLRMNQKEAAFLRKFFGGLSDIHTLIKTALINSYGITDEPSFEEAKNIQFELYEKLFEVVK